MKARSKPPKPSLSFTQNKFGSHSNDPSPQRSQNLPPHRHKHKRSTTDPMFVKPDHYKKSQRYLFRHFLKAVLQRWRAGGEGLSPLLHPGSSMTRAHSHARTSHLALCVQPHSHSLTTDLNKAGRGHFPLYNCHDSFFLTIL